MAQILDRHLKRYNDAENPIVASHQQLDSDTVVKQEAKRRKVGDTPLDAISISLPSQIPHVLKFLPVKTFVHDFLRPGDVITYFFAICFYFRFQAVQL